MAIITNATLTNQIADLINDQVSTGGSIDVSQLIQLINTGLPSEQQLAQGVGTTFGVYKRFGEFDKIDAKVEVVTTGLWSGDEGSLTTFFTSSAQATSTSGKYYYNIYKTSPATDPAAEVQFAVAYGHLFGSGSPSLSVNDNSVVETKATYTQYRTLLLDPNDTYFTFLNSAGTGYDSDAIYVINLNRARFREKMDAQNWSLQLSGSNGLFTFIDDSGKKFNDAAGSTGRVFNVVEGDLQLGTGNEATTTTTTAPNGQGYGLFYPDQGLIILNPTALGSKLGNVLFSNPIGSGEGSLSGAVTNNSSAYNHSRLFSAIKLGGDFEARRTENISTQHFFVRATNREFNYSNNPTFANEAGVFTEKSFEVDPNVYVTTVGLYNDSNELVAVAKTSQPIPKSFSKELLIKVKIDF
jgi:hypothetical protein